MCTVKVSKKGANKIHREQVPDFGSSLYTIFLNVYSHTQVTGIGQTADLTNLQKLEIIIKRRRTITSMALKASNQDPRTKLQSELKKP